MRGLYTASFLNDLVEQAARRRGVPLLDLGAGFDLIAGTSTGAIVACAVAMGKPLREVVDLYRRHGSDIFPHRITGLASVVFRAFTGGRYVRRGDAALRAALSAVLGDATMADVYCTRGISLVVPTVKMSTHHAYVFKKTRTSGVRDDGQRLADVCLASSAAPIYRSLAAITVGGSVGPCEVFADGGLWANNPVMVGFADALANAAPGQPIEIFSLGTCPRPEGEHVTAEGVHRSLPGWRLGADVGPLSIAAQEFAYDNMARFFAKAFVECGRSVSVVRFPNRPVPASMMPHLALDDARVVTLDRLARQARTDADMTLSACDDPLNGNGKLIARLLANLPPAELVDGTFTSARMPQKQES